MGDHRRRAAIAVTVGAVLAGPAAAQEPELFVGSASELFTNLTLIDGRGGSPQPNASILVWNGRIQGAGPRSSMQVPQGTQIVDLEGAFVVPGYIDVYAAPRDSATLAGMLTAGITGVREAAMPLDLFEAHGREVAGDGPRPTVFIGGPILEGPGGSSAMPDGSVGLTIPSPDAIDEAVERLVDDDARFVSVAASIPPEWVRDISRAARRGDAPVWVEQRTEGWLLALRMGAEVAGPLVSLDPDLVDETNRAAYAALLARSPAAALAEWLRLLDPNGPEVETAISALLSRDAALAPLLAATEAPVRCVSPGDGCDGWSDAERDAFLSLWPAALELTGRMHDQNVRLLVGSGVPSSPHSPARFHRELELLVDAGIAPLDVLSMATRNGAIALGELHRRGTIERGKVADFVILGADPTADIRNARQIRAVVLDGRGWLPLPEGGFQRVRWR
jgi:hypothetical protein